jgi:hypothetical protein
MPISRGARGARKRRSDSPLKSVADPRVPIRGDRLRLALGTAGLSENQAARLLRDRRLARISQPALNNISTGKTRSCRRSVRDGLAALCGEPITSAWLGGEGELEEAILGEEAAREGLMLMPWDIRAHIMLLAFERAWKRDRPLEEFPKRRLLSLIQANLDPESLMFRLYFPHAYTRNSPNPRDWNPLPYPHQTYQQRDSFSKHAFEAAMIALQPWFDNPGCANWDLLLAFEERGHRGAQALLEALNNMPEQWKPEIHAEVHAAKATYDRTIWQELLRARKPIGSAARGIQRPRTDAKQEK